MGILWGWVTQLSGFNNLPAAFTLGFALLVWSTIQWHRKRTLRKMAGIQLWHVWIFSLIGLWLFVTLTLTTWAYTIIYPPTQISSPFAPPRNDEGPLTFYYNLTLSGGFGHGVQTLMFHGHNTSQQEIRIISAQLISTFTGDALDLKAMAENVPTEVKNINVVPSGAPIQLLATFGAPENQSQDAFLKKWSKFSLVVRDEKREYRLSFNEGNIAPFFPGVVGPHITAKN
jgi:hypothetical protein